MGVVGGTRAPAFDVERARYGHFNVDSLGRRLGFRSG
jgi:hypothetical protein